MKTPSKKHIAATRTESFLNALRRNAKKHKGISWSSTGTIVCIMHHDRGNDSMSTRMLRILAAVEQAASVATGDTFTLHMNLLTNSVTVDFGER